MLSNQATGHLEYLNAKRDAGLSCVRDARAKARILGVPYTLPPAKEHRITVDLKSGEKTVEAIDPAQKANPFKREPVVYRPIPETRSIAERIAEAQQRRLEKKLGRPPDPTITIKAIIACVCVAFDVTEGDLVSNSRQHRVARPRFAAVRMMRELRCMSFPQIARALQRADHTTPMSNLARAAELHADDRDWRARYDHALALLKAPKEAGDPGGAA